MRSIRITAGLVLLAVFCGGVTEAATLIGKAYVTDGDTVRISGKSIRLSGIDAPETKQMCRDFKNASYPCGLLASQKLSEKTGKSAVKCETEGKDRYGRLLAICYLGELDLNGWLVRSGYALAYVRYSDRYVSEQREAREAGRGIWSGKFVPPWRWRKGERLADENI